MKLTYKPKKSILAFGADGKGRFTFLKSGQIKSSRDFGSLEDVRNFEGFEQAIDHVIKKDKPAVLACDMHPEYNSTKLALSLKHFKGQGNKSYKLRPIQHHHAHIASCMLDNNLTGNVIGVAFDGTGFGEDNTIWGGEFLIASPKRFKRIAHLEYIPMPSGEMSIKEPWRMALSYLYRFYGDKLFDLKIPFIKSIDRKKALILKEMIKNNINSPKTSSAGRFFDAVSALVNLTNITHYEGEAPIKLEKLAKKSEPTNAYYKISFKTKNKQILIFTERLIKGVIKDINSGVNKEKIALKFHNSVAHMTFDVSMKLATLYKVNKVALSGGVFLNKVLLNKIEELFKDSQVLLYTHRNIPTSDAGISIGQASIAARGT